MASKHPLHFVAAVEVIDFRIPVTAIRPLMTVIQAPSPFQLPNEAVGPTTVHTPKYLGPLHTLHFDLVDCFLSGGCQQCKVRRSSSEKYASIFHFINVPTIVANVNVVLQR